METAVTQQQHANCVNPGHRTPPQPSMSSSAGAGAALSNGQAGGGGPGSSTGVAAYRGEKRSHSQVDINQGF